MIKLEPYEKETVINFDESSTVCQIYTRSKSVMSKCDKAGYKVTSEDDISKTYKTNKKFISFRTQKVVKRKVSEEHMKKMRESKDK